MGGDPGAVGSGREHDPPSLGLCPLSRVRLDELLQEVLDRVGEVVTSRERLRALLDAVVDVSSDLDLRHTLQRVVEAACALAGARCGALGMIGADQQVADFVTHGIDPDARARIGGLPHGRGVRGLPSQQSFLVVPVLVRDQVFGNLYLTEKEGAAEFTEDDEEIVVALAAAAGVAIDNARLFAASGRRERIAADLHDVVLQRLSAVGSRLRTVTAQPLPPDVDNRIIAAMDDLDATIRDIRDAVHKLQDPTGVQGPMALFPAGFRREADPDTPPDADRRHAPATAAPREDHHARPAR